MVETNVSVEFLPFGLGSHMLFFVLKTISLAQHSAPTHSPVKLPLKLSNSPSALSFQES